MKGREQRNKGKGGQGARRKEVVKKIQEAENLCQPQPELSVQRKHFKSGVRGLASDFKTE